MKTARAKLLRDSPLLSSRLESQQSADRKDVVGVPAAISMVTTNRDVALVVEQPVEDMQGFACRRRNHLGVERCITVREVGVELASRFISVMGVEAGRVATEAAGSEELTVRRRGKTAAKHRRKRLALPLVDQPSQRQGVGLIANMPVSRPRELIETGDRAGLCHACQAKIEPVGEQACQKMSRST